MQRHQSAFVGKQVLWPVNGPPQQLKRPHETCNEKVASRYERAQLPDIKLDATSAVASEVKGVRINNL